MADIIRAEIYALVERTGLTPYGVWRLIDKRIARSGINKYLVGKQDFCGAHLSIILVALRAEAKKHKMPG